jgi:tetratricopeptide (TPR) repeat protein
VFGTLRFAARIAPSADISGSIRYGPILEARGILSLADVMMLRADDLKELFPVDMGGRIRLREKIEELKDARPTNDGGSAIHPPAAAAPNPPSATPTAPMAAVILIEDHVAEVVHVQQCNEALQYWMICRQASDGSEQCTAAANVHRQAVEAAEKELGANHGIVLMAWCCRVELQEDLSAAATQLLLLCPQWRRATQQAVDIERDAGNPGDVGLGTTLLDVGRRLKASFVRTRDGLIGGVLAHLYPLDGQPASAPAQAVEICRLLVKMEALAVRDSGLRHVTKADSRSLGRLNGLLACALIQTGETTEAAAVIRVLETAESDIHYPTPDLVDITDLLLGELLLRSGDYASAKRHYKLMKRDYRDNADAVNLIRSALARVATGQQQTQKAQQLCEKVYEYFEAMNGASSDIAQRAYRVLIAAWGANGSTIRAHGDTARHLAKLFEIPMGVGGTNDFLGQKFVAYIMKATLLPVVAQEIVANFLPEASGSAPADAAGAGTVPREAATAAAAVSLVLHSLHSTF